MSHFLGLPTNHVALLLIAALTAILFLQSGLDKLFNYSGNHSYFESHFSKSPLAKTIGLLLPAITFLEIASGAAAVGGAVLLLLNGQIWLFFASQCLAAISLLSLFLGQRLAKDYGGALSLVPYFIVALIGILLV